MLHIFLISRFTLVLCLAHHMLLSNKYDEVKNDEEEKFFMPCDFCFYLFLSLSTMGRILLPLFHFSAVVVDFKTDARKLKCSHAACAFFELLYPSKWEKKISHHHCRSQSRVTPLIMCVCLNIEAQEILLEYCWCLQRFVWYGNYVI